MRDYSNIFAPEKSIERPVSWNEKFRYRYLKNNGYKQRIKYYLYFFQCFRLPKDGAKEKTSQKWTMKSSLEVCDITMTRILYIKLLVKGNVYCRFLHLWKVYSTYVIFIYFGGNLKHWKIQIIFCNVVYNHLCTIQEFVSGYL